MSGSVGSEQELPGQHKEKTNADEPSNRLNIIHQPIMEFETRSAPSLFGGSSRDNECLNGSLESKVERNRERNREHAKKTRLRKKAMIEGMKGKLLELQRESTRLEQLLEENKTANILLLLADKSEEDDESAVSREQNGMPSYGPEDLESIDVMSGPYAVLSNTSSGRGNIIDQLRHKVRAEAAQIIRESKALSGLCKVEVPSSASPTNTATTAAGRARARARASSASGQLSSLSGEGSDGGATSGPSDNSSSYGSSSSVSRANSSLDAHGQSQGQYPYSDAEGDGEGERELSKREGVQVQEDGTVDSEELTVDGANQHQHRVFGEEGSCCAAGDGDEGDDEGAVLDWQTCNEFRASKSRILDPELQKRERNRMHAKLTRDRKKLFTNELNQTISSLERKNMILRSRLETCGIPKDVIYNGGAGGGGGCIAPNPIPPSVSLALSAAQRGEEKELHIPLIRAQVRRGHAHVLSQMSIPAGHPSLLPPHPPLLQHHQSSLLPPALMIPAAAAAAFSNGCSFPPQHTLASMFAAAEGNEVDNDQLRSPLTCQQQPQQQLQLQQPERKIKVKLEKVEVKSEKKRRKLTTHDHDVLEIRKEKEEEDEAGDSDASTSASAVSPLTSTTTTNPAPSSVASPTPIPSTAESKTTVPATPSPHVLMPTGAGASAGNNQPFFMPMHPGMPYPFFALPPLAMAGSYHHHYHHPFLAPTMSLPAGMSVPPSRIPAGLTAPSSAAAAPSVLITSVDKEEKKEEKGKGSGEARLEGENEKKGLVLETRAEEATGITTMVGVGGHAAMHYPLPVHSLNQNQQIHQPPSAAAAAAIAAFAAAAASHGIHPEIFAMYLRAAEAGGAMAGGTGGCSSSAVGGGGGGVGMGAHCPSLSPAQPSASSSSSSTSFAPYFHSSQLQQQQQQQEQHFLSQMHQHPLFFLQVPPPPLAQQQYPGFPPPPPINHQHKQHLESHETKRDERNVPEQTATGINSNKKDSAQ